MDKKLIAYTGKNSAELNDVCAEYIFGGTTVYFETMMFVAEKDGSFVPVRTLFEPDEIIAVQSTSLETVYARGLDYTIRDGGIMPAENTSMPYFKHDQYYLGNDAAIKSFPMAEGRLVFEEGAYFHERQICVSYVHSQGQKCPIAEDKSAKLPKVREKIKNKKEINVLFNGDSIAVGANSSGMKAINVKPHIPPFPDLFAYKIEKTHNMKVNLANIAVGGTSSSWGIEQSAKYLGDDKNAGPDLYVIAFGMNDASGKIPAENYISNIKAIIAGARSIYPDCEFILVATMLPNPVLPGFSGPHAEYAKQLLALENEISGAAVADMTAMHQFLLEKKRYQDMTGNNVNHPNDFLARIYAQLLLRTLGVKN